MGAVKVLIFIIMIVLIILLAINIGKLAPITAAAVVGGASTAFDILESAPLNSPDSYEGGRETNSADLPTLYGNFIDDLQNEETDKFEKNLSIVDVDEPDVIIGFHFANWCIYCKDVKSKWGDVIKELRKINNTKGGKKYAVISINEERHRNLSITTIPTIILYDVANKSIERYHGKSKPKKILEWILAETK